MAVLVLACCCVLCICDECGSYKHIIYYTVIYAQIIRFIASQYIRPVASLAFVPRNVVASAMTVFEVLCAVVSFFFFFSSKEGFQLLLYLFSNRMNFIIDVYTHRRHNERRAKFYGLK